MVKPKYLYDIFDVIENDFVIIKARSIEVTEIIGMPHEILSGYSKKGGVYQDRYRVTRRPFEEGTISIVTTSDIPLYLWEEFEAVTKHIRENASPRKLKKILIKQQDPLDRRKTG